MNLHHSLKAVPLLLALVMTLLTGLSAVVVAQDEPILVEARGNQRQSIVIELPRITPSNSSPELARELSDVIIYDLNMSGIVTPEGRDPLFSREMTGFDSVDYASWSAGGVGLLVRGAVTVKGSDGLNVEFRLYDIAARSALVAKRYLGTRADLRKFAHSFADEILLALTGERGSFAAKVAYVTTQSGNKEIAVMDWDGHNMRAVTSNGSINLNPDFSPDGNQLLFTSYKRGNPDLYRRLLTSASDTPISQRKGLNVTGVWSPDGASIALTLSKDGNSEIYSLSKDGGNPLRLTNSSAIEVSPAWSPDGKKIAFVSDRLGKPQIFVMDANGSNVRRLTTSGSYNVTPRWSPKGDRIAYARMIGGGFQIFTIAADGSADMQLTTQGSNENPAWSADGRFIVFASKRGGPEALYVMRADGSGQTKVSRSKGGSSQPAWSRQ